MSTDLSKIQKEILVGILLGDAHLRENKKGTKASLVVLQSDAHKEYLFHLYDVFKEVTKSSPKPYEFTDKRFPGKTYKRWSFATRMLESLMPYAKLF